MKVKSEEVERVFDTVIDQVDTLKKLLYKSADPVKEINENDLNLQIDICKLTLDRLRNLQKY